MPVFRIVVSDIFGARKQRMHGCDKAFKTDYIVYCDYVSQKYKGESIVALQQKHFPSERAKMLHYTYPAFLESSVSKPVIPLTFFPLFSTAQVTERVTFNLPLFVVC